MRRYAAIARMFLTISIIVSILIGPGAQRARAQQGYPGTLTILAATCPSGYVGDASSDECDNRPTSGMPFRTGIPNSDAFTLYQETDEHGLIALPLITVPTIRIHGVVPDATARYIVFCVDERGSPLEIVYPEDYAGMYGVGSVDIVIKNAIYVLCDWYNVPVQATTVPNEPIASFDRCSASQAEAPAISETVMYRGTPGRTGEQPGPGPTGIPLLNESFLAGISPAPEGRSPCAIHVEEGTALIATGSSVFVGGLLHAQGTNDVSGVAMWGLFRMSADDGHIYWFAPLAPGASARGYVSAAAVSGDAVYVGTTSNLFRLDARTGAEQWRFQVDIGVFSSPIEVDGVVYSTTIDGVIYAIDAETGAEIWHLWLGDWALSDPAVADGAVYVAGSDGSLYAIDVANGNPKWRYEASAPPGTSPVVSDGLVYITTEQGAVLAINTKNGSEKWRGQLPVSPSATTMAVSSVGVANGQVYIGSSGYLTSLDTATGDEIWRIETDGTSMSSPAVAGETIFSVSIEGMVYAVDAKSGTKIWSYKTPVTGQYGEDGRPNALPSPAVSGGTVYFTNAHGRIYAVTGR